MNRFTVDSKLMTFCTDKVMSYPQLIVWALEMRRMMDVTMSVCRRASSGVLRRPGFRPGRPVEHGGPLRMQLYPGGSSCKIHYNQREKWLRRGGKHSRAR